MGLWSTVYISYHSLHYGTSQEIGIMLVFLCFIVSNSSILTISIHVLQCYSEDSSPPSAAYMRQGIGSALVQIMACRQFGAKPLSKPLLDYYQLDPWEQSSGKFQSKYKTLQSQKCIWKYRLRNGRHFVQGGISYKQWHWSNHKMVYSSCGVSHFPLVPHICVREYGLHWFR